MKVFSVAKFIEDMGINHYHEYGNWTHKCEGKTEKECKELGCWVHDDWMVEMPDELEKSGNFFVAKPKKYTMRDFMKESVQVMIPNAKTRDAFLKRCDEAGIKWNSGESVTKWTPDYMTFPYYLIYGLYGEGITVGKKSPGYKVVKVEDFEDATQTPTAPYRIVIECDNDITTATMTINGKEVKTTTTKRHPNDKFDWKVGAQTAFDRLWERPEEKGIRYRCVGYKKSEKYFTLGKVYTLEENGDLISDTGFRYPASVHGDVIEFLSEWYEWEKVGETEEKPKWKKSFKVGDRVVCIDAGSAHRGHCGVVKVCDNDGLYGVEYDLDIGGHALGGFDNEEGKLGHCWWENEWDIAHIMEV